MKIVTLRLAALISVFASSVFSLNASATNFEKMTTIVSESCEGISLNDPIAGVYSDGVEGKYAIGIMKLATGGYTFQVLADDAVVMEFDKTVNPPRTPTDTMYMDYSKNSPRGGLQSTDSVSLYFSRQAGLITNTELSVSNQITTKDGGRERNANTSFSFSSGLQIVKCIK